MAPVLSIIRKADRLSSAETSNRAELFMSYVAKYNCGKRLNLTQRENFQRRSVAALHYQNGRTWHIAPWKKLFGEQSPKNTILDAY